MSVHNENQNPITWTQAAFLAKECQKKGGKVVTTNGCFDLLHRGHVSYLQAAKKLGDLLLVAINSDKSVAALKGPARPLNKENDRAFVLGALRCVDAVCVFDESTPNEWLKAIQPEIHVKGGDWKPENMPETPVMAQWGGTVKVLPFIDGYSTTSLIEKSKTLR